MIRFSDRMTGIMKTGGRTNHSKSRPGLKIQRGREALATVMEDDDFDRLGVVGVQSFHYGSGAPLVCSNPHEIRRLVMGQRAKLDKYPM
jgi:hypothetical protein